MSAHKAPTARELAAKLAAGDLTAEALVCEAFERIAAHEDEIKAWAHLDRAAAIAAAKAADKAGRPGPLHGLPFGVKDIFDTADMPTAYGSKIYAGNRPAWDAASVALARAAGGIALGKTVTTQFAFVDPAPTRNPRNPAHTPGGSSSGSAAAVAAGMVPLATGTQTVGSVIRPASFCGVVGYKPTFGLIPTAGVKCLAASLDTIGAFAATVGDVALFAGALGGRDLSFPALKPKIGLCRTPQWPQATEGLKAAFAEAETRLKNAGADLRDVVLPAAFEGLAEAQHEVLAYEAARSFASEWHYHRAALGPRVGELIVAGLQTPAATYDAAMAKAARARAVLDDAFGDVDVLLAPSAPGEAPHGLGSTGDPIFSRMWTFLGTPCVNLPGLTGPRGLPIGVQAIGRRGDDLRALAAADWMQPRLG